MAKLSAATSVVLIAAAALTLWVTSHPGPGATTVNAEFEDAFPILAGMNVRVSGAIAGSVREVELTDEGTAMVTLSLNPGTTPPKEDAAAAIRQQDVTGDSYVSLSPGSAPEPLGDETIPTSRTLVAPRFDDLLNSFADPERQALKTILIETGVALESRGDDLNRAALELRPALEATDNALAEVGSQNQALRALVTDAADVTGQAAEHSSELPGLVDSLSTTLQTTAAHGPALDRALERLPQTTVAAKGTLAELRHAAEAATPLARSLLEGAPGLATALERSGPFLGDARRALHNTGPTLDASTELFRKGRSTLLAAGDHVVTAPYEIAGNIDEFLKSLLGNEDALKALFGADSMREYLDRRHDPIGRMIGPAVDMVGHHAAFAAMEIVSADPCTSSIWRWLLVAGHGSSLLSIIGSRASPHRRRDQGLSSARHWRRMRRGFPICLSCA